MGIAEGVLKFDAGSELDEADRALAAAAHRYHTAKTEESRQRMRQELRRAAVLFTAAVSDVAALNTEARIK